MQRPSGANLFLCDQVIIDRDSNRSTLVGLFDGADAEDAAAEGEGVVYWFGLELGERAMVTTLVVPDADTTRGSIRTSAAANAEALSVITDTPLVLLGQAHSHPWRRVVFPQPRIPFARIARGDPATPLCSEPSTSRIFPMPTSWPSPSRVARRHIGS